MLNSLMDCSLEMLQFIANGKAFIAEVHDLSLEEEDGMGGGGALWG